MDNCESNLPSIITRWVLIGGFTQWNALAAHTTPPYTLSLKSNGCIIFIAALTPSKLLVTSKHSLGPLQGISETHAQAGERWLKIHLEARGKTTEELAATLWENNWTAIAEVTYLQLHLVNYPTHFPIPALR
jgi:tRNA ligase